MIKLFYIINNKGQVRIMKHYDPAIVTPLIHQLISYSVRETVKM